MSGAAKRNSAALATPINFSSLLPAGPPRDGGPTRENRNANEINTPRVCGLWPGNSTVSGLHNSRSAGLHVGNNLRRPSVVAPDTGLLKPTAKRHQGLPSGTRIKRRPPSLPPQHARGSPAPSFITYGENGSPPVNGTFLTPATGGEPEPTPSAPRLFRFEHRTEPSPAPSRRPLRDTNRLRKPCPLGSPGSYALSRIVGEAPRGDGAFRLSLDSSTNNATDIANAAGSSKVRTRSTARSASVGTRVSRSASTNVRKRRTGGDPVHQMAYATGIRPPSSRHLSVVVPCERHSRQEKEQALRHYLKLCAEVGEEPNDAWVTVITKSVEDGSSSAEPQNLQAHATDSVTAVPLSSAGSANLGTAKPVSGRQRRVTPPPSTSATSVGPKVGTHPPRIRGKSSSTVNRTSTTTVGGIHTANLSTSINKTTSTTSCGSGSRKSSLQHASVFSNTQCDNPHLADVCMDHMLAYCSNHLNPNHQRKESLRQARADVQRALDGFLAVCNADVRIHAEPRVVLSNEVLSPVNEVLSCFVSTDISPRENDARFDNLTSALATVNQHAQALSSSLEGVQQSVVHLLLSLGNCAKDSRVPLGTTNVSLHLANAHTVNAFQDSQISIRAGMDGCKSPMGNAATVPLLPDIPVITVMSPPEATIPHLTDSSPRGFTGFLKSEERAISVQLQEVCEQVNAALKRSPLVRIDNEAPFQTPLFVWPPSSTLEASQGDTLVSGRSCAASLGSGGLKTPGGRSTATTPRNRCGKSKTASSHTNVSSSRGHQHANELSGALPSVFFSVALQQPAATTKVADTSTVSDSCNSALSPVVVVGRHTTGSISNEGSSLNTPRSVKVSQQALTKKSSSALLARSRDKRLTSTCSRSSSVGAGRLGAKPVTGVSQGNKKKKAGSQKGSRDVSAADTITMAQLEEAKEIWSTLRSLLSLSTTEHRDAATGDHLRCTVSEMHVSPRIIAGLVPTCSPAPIEMGPGAIASPSMGFDAVEEMGDTTDYLTQPRKIQGSNASSSSQHPGVGLLECSTGDSATDAMHFQYGEAMCTASQTMIPLYSSVPDDASPSLRPAEALSGVPIERSTGCGSMPEREISESSSAKSGRIQRQAVGVIATCWLRYQARKRVSARRAEVALAAMKISARQLEQLHLNHLQRFLWGLICRRRIRTRIREAQLQNRSVLPHPRTATDSDPTSATRALHSTAPSPVNEHSSRARFLKAKEQRKAFTVTGDKNPGTNASSSGTPLSPVLECNGVAEARGRSFKVPLLPLVEHGISTSAIGNYNADADSFQIAVLHRLMNAPQPLLYLVRVISDRYPKRPPMGFAKPPAHTTAACSQSPEREAPTEHEVSPSRTSSARKSAETRETEEKARQDGVYQIPYRSIRAFLNLHADLLYLSSGKENCSRGTPPAPGQASQSSSFLPAHHASSLIPLSVRYDSYVDHNELRHAEPTVKSFQRPFERWGIAHNFACRIFSAATTYAWKLIFSHTPHDDAKQRQLRTWEDQQSRLERVDQRNRMILACYGVRSEREWMREASKDLSFVGQIWSPKKFLDADDPDLDRHSKEMYEFVDEFLHQCFPTVHTLDDIASFLLGAGVYFVLKEVFHYSVDQPDASVLLNRFPQLTADALVHPPCSSTVRLSPTQQRIIQRFELLDSIRKLCQWNPRGSRASLSEECATGGTRYLFPNNATLSVNETHLNTHSGEVSKPFLQYAYPSMSLDWLRHRRHGLRTTEDTDDHVMDALVSNSCRARLVRVPVSATTPAPQSPHPTALSVEDLLQETPREQEQRVAHALFDWWQNGGGTLKSGDVCSLADENVADTLVLSIVYPKHFLVELSEALVYSLLGLRLDLDVCEDLEAME